MMADDNNSCVPDQESFSRLVKKHQKNILYLAFDFVGNYQDAKDIAQDTFIKAFQKYHQFRNESKISTWLYRIAVNTALDFRKKSKSRKMCYQDFENNQRESYFPDKVDEIDSGREIRNIIARLSPNQRSVIILKYFHEKSTAEIAEILDCSEGSVRTHLFRALKKFKSDLTKRCKYEQMQI
jgi:RNA polymerase sigma-70 factor, ECF subfamily